jgi:hypothetical protein
VERANASLASKGVTILAEAHEKIASARQALIDGHRKKLKLQETRFRARREELHGEINDLKKKLAGADERCRTVLWARAVAEA